MSADELKINHNLIDSNLEFIQRTIYKWLEIINKDFIVQKEVIKQFLRLQNLKHSDKPFKIKIGKFLIIKDYENLLIEAEIINPKTFIINSKDDLYLAEEFINWLDLVNAIKRNNENILYNFKWFCKL